MSSRSPQASESISTGQAFSELGRWIQLVVASLAVFSGTMYGIGYLVTFSQMRMLGLGMIEVSNQEILKRVLSMPLLSLVCVLYAVFTWRGLILAVLMLVVYLRPGICGLLVVVPEPPAKDDDASTTLPEVEVPEEPSSPMVEWRRAAGPWILACLVMAVSVMPLS